MRQIIEIIQNYKFTVKKWSSEMVAYLLDSRWRSMMFFSLMSYLMNIDGALYSFSKQGIYAWQPIKIVPLITAYYGSKIFYEGRKARREKSISIIEMKKYIFKYFIVGIVGSTVVILFIQFYLYRHWGIDIDWITGMTKAGGKNHYLLDLLGSIF